MSTERVKHQPGPVAHHQASTFALLQETVPCNFPSQTSSTTARHMCFFFRIYTTASSLYLKVSQPGPLDLPMAASFPESSAQRHGTSARSDVPTMSAPSSRGGLRKTRDRCRRVDRCQNLPLGWRARWEEQTPW